MQRSEPCASRRVFSLQRERPAFFALLAATPDLETAEKWIVARFGVDQETATIALDQSVRTLLRKPSAE